MSLPGLLKPPAPKRAEVADSLDNFSVKIGDTASTSSTQFIQIHKSFIVNINCIEKVGEETMLLKGNISVHLGRKY
jgi:DNA-binding LytR/AlgR family response regulator